MRIEEFDRMEAREAAELLRRCVPIDSWAEAVLEQRPYAAVADLLACARMHAATWTPEEVEAALVDEPSGHGADDRYQRRFGRVYLVSPRGRSTEELRDLLEERLANDAQTELSVTKEQLAEVALLRLEAAFG